MDSKAEKKKQAKLENEFMQSITNPLYRFIYGLIKYELKETLAVCLAIAIILNLADINIKEFIIGLIK